MTYGLGALLVCGAVVLLLAIAGRAVVEWLEDGVPEKWRRKP